MSHLPEKPVRYHRFLLSIWEERDEHGRRVTWRISLQNTHKEERIGFINLDELLNYLQDWMKSSE